MRFRSVLAKCLMRAAYRRVDYARALALAERVLAKVPDDFEAIRTKVYIKAVPLPEFCDYGQAVAIAEAAAQRAVNDVERWLVLAHVHELGGEHGDAERTFRKVLGLEPDNLEAVVGLSILPGAPGTSITVEEAQVLLDRTAQIYPLRWEPYYYQAHIRWQLGKLDEAKALFEIARRRIPRTNKAMRESVDDGLRKVNFLLSTTSSPSAPERKPCDF